MAPLELITGMPHLQMELDVIRQKLVHMQPRSQSVAVNPPDLRSLFPKRFHQWQWLQPVAVPPVAMSTIWFHLRYPQLRIPRYPQLRIPTPGSPSTMFHMWHLGSQRHDSRPDPHQQQVPQIHQRRSVSFHRRIQRQCNHCRQRVSSMAHP